MGRVLRFLFHGVFVRFVVLFLLGLNVRHRERLPAKGPAILTANHNSHLDAMVLTSLLPLRLLPRVRPVAAADYFLRNRVLGWFATRVVGILPIARKRTDRSEDPLAGCDAALARGDILIFFPEGSRGEPEQLAEFKRGIGLLAQRHPDVPIYPIFTHGLGKALPRNEALLVPFFQDVFVGEPLYGRDGHEGFAGKLRERIVALGQEGQFAEWD
ncbi:MAG: lysophospholipid acyltransferase family protein [Gammaproteobacteria bacterium]|jgi:1-acyl-sn-glycerol-3-phosphate acyltransferase